MANIAVKRITNANVFLNGKNVLGKAESIDLPDIKFIYSDHKSLGMIGKLKLPSGIDNLEAKIKWNAFYSDIMGDIYNPFKANILQIRANNEAYAAAGRTAQTGLVTFLTGSFMNADMGKYKQHDNVESESTFNCTGIRQVDNGIVTLEYDVLTNIYKVNGVDVFEQYHINTGA